MKVGIILPDRNDRPEFLENCLRMIKSQTLKPDHIELINDQPINDKCDITWRYRNGYDRLRNKSIDVIALIENDDWYSPDYLETMVKSWEEKGKPDLLGINYSIYYHLKLRRYFKMSHRYRAAAMNTIIKPDLNFKWCKDTEAYTDVHLWQTLKGVLFSPDKIISMGIKHGIGMCGGGSHTNGFHQYKNPDPDFSYLKNTIDADSFNFYSNHIKNNE